MDKLRVLFIFQEITPYLPESYISNLGRNLPQAIQEDDKEIRTFMPKFGCINERRNQLHEVIRLSGMNLIIDDADHPLIIKVASIQAARMQIYFIDNEDYFGRKHTFRDDKGNELEDNDERSIFFNRGVIETIIKLNWSPQIIHCHGWFTGLTPLYIKKAFRDNPIFADSKIVYSMYNDIFQQSLDQKFSEKIKIEGVEDSDVDIVKTPTYENLNKLAIDFSDGVVFGDQNINDNLKKYVAEKNVPNITHVEDKESYVKLYSDFYEKILG